ncbi:MAG: hypothetical protein WBV61_03770 [Rhodanobacteraceae bacterium]
MKAIAGSLALLLALSAHAAPRTFALRVTDGKLAGPGADVIRAQLPNAQFVLFGEDHGFADSPIVLRAIAREARPLGFRYLVVEVGPLSARMIGETLQKDGLGGVHKLVDEVPLGIPFLSLKDDAVLASDYLGKDANGMPFLWGVDQEFIGSPVFHLERLVAIAADKPARAAAQKLLAEERSAAAKAAQKDFLLVRFGDKDFDAFAAHFEGNAEAQRIIAQLKESAAIYQLWMNGHNYENNARRARLLARNFLAAFRSAGKAQPKVVFKMGIEHLSLGTTSINTIDLGTLVSEIARFHDKTALRIAFLPTGGRNVSFQPKPGNPATVHDYKGEEAAAFFPAIGIDPAMLAKDSWTLVPLDPIRQSLDTKGIEALKPLARVILLGYDYVITTPDATAGVSLY